MDDRLAIQTGIELYKMLVEKGHELGLTKKQIEEGVLYRAQDEFDQGRSLVSTGILSAAEAASPGFLKRNRPKSTQS